MTDIIRDIKARGLHLSKLKGQCLLIDDSVMDRILDAADVKKGDLVIDIGTGPGHTVKKIMDRASAYIGIEKDAACYAMALDRTAGIAHCALVNADILANKHTINPEALDRIEEMIAAEKPERVKIVANLPYSVATPVIVQFLLQDRIKLDLITVMVQKEVGCRLTARDGSGAYGAVSVIVAAAGNARMVFDVGSGAFFPSPKVQSSVVVITPFEPGRRAVAEARIRAFEQFIGKVFNFRKKTIANAIQDSHVTAMNKAFIMRLFRENGMDPDKVMIRHTPEEMIAVFDIITTHGDAA